MKKEQGTETAKAAISLTATIENNTDKTMIYKKTIMHGGGMVDAPTPKIPAGSKGKFKAESTGVFTGTEGTVVYLLEGVSGECRLKFSNPYAGKNEYSATAPKGYEASVGGGSGDHAKVTYTIR